MKTAGMLAATKAKTDTARLAINAAKALLRRELESGELLEHYTRFRQSNEGPFITLTYFLSRTIRSDTGAPLNQRYLYKERHAKLRSDVEGFCAAIQKALTDLAASTPVSESETQILKNRVAELEALVSKMRDYLHVCYARERQRRKDARDLARATTPKVTPLHRR